MSVIEKTAGKKARSKDRGDLVIDSELEATRADLLRSRHLALEVLHVRRNL